MQITIDARGGFFAGIILLGVATAVTLRDARSAHWLSAPGTLGWGPSTCHAASHVYHEYGAPKTVCEPHVYYRYHVGDQDYTGTRVTFQDALLTYFDWSWEARYIESSHVTVHYNPIEPAAAVLEPRTPGKALLWLLAAALTVGFGQTVFANRNAAEGDVRPTTCDTRWHSVIRRHGALSVWMPAPRTT